MLSGFILATGTTPSKLFCRNVGSNFSKTDNFEQREKRRAASIPEAYTISLNTDMEDDLNEKIFLGQGSCKDSRREQVAGLRQNLQRADSFTTDWAKDSNPSVLR